MEEAGCPLLTIFLGQKLPSLGALGYETQNANHAPPAMAP